MRLPGLLRPLQASGLGCYIQSPAYSIFHLPDRLSQLRLNAANTVVEGRRCASVKSQGAYKKKNKKTIPKKLGAKRVGDQYVIPGNIIYKQRGTIWHPGENTILGRDHTIHAAVEGYVKYYRDPSLHPTRQFIGVAFERTDTLPYPKRSVRHRKLGLVATPRRHVEALPWLSPSGIPNTLVRAGDAVKVIASSEAHTVGTTTSGSNDEQGADLTLPDRLYHLKKDYSYRESNWQLGRLVGKVGTQIGSTKHWSRKAVFRNRRRKREKELTALKAMAQDQAKAKAAAREKEKAKRLEEAARAAEEQAKREARLAALEALEAEGPVQAEDRKISPRV